MGGLVATVGGHSHNPTSNDDKTTDGQVLVCFKQRSENKKTGQQTNEHLEYGREFYCNLFRLPTCCSQVISDNHLQIKYITHAYFL